MTNTPNIDPNDHDEFEPAPPDKLYAHYCRQLSAMMDGELSPDEAKFMLRRLEHDAALAGCWERWQVCGDVLRGRRHVLLPADFARRVASAIGDHDVAIAVSRTNARPRLARWGGGAALAASVAVVALLVARQLPGDAAPAPDPSSAIVARQAPATPPTPAPITPPGTPADTAPGTAAGTAGTGTVLAATAVAVADVPRRAAERRARAQARRAPDRVQAAAAAPQPELVAVDLPVLAQVPATDTAPAVVAETDPFAAPQIAPTRPWPRAILRTYPADSAFSAGYGDSVPAAGFAPFEPRLDPGATQPQADVDGTRADAAPSDDTGPR